MAGSGREFTIAVIGAGPRGTSFMERLLALVERTDARTAQRLRLLVIDPAPHGPGRVWDPEQSPLYLMNTPASYPTAAPSDETLEHLPASSVSISFLVWARQNGLTYEATDYPTRADYGRYLRWLQEMTTERLQDAGVVVKHLLTEVTALSPAADGYSLTLADREDPMEVNAAVLALGHLPAHLTGGAEQLARSAAELGLHYIPASVPTDVDYASFPAGETVLVRGMGLNFFDLMIQVTVGRGGEFVPVPGAPAGRTLEYRPSGDEPHLAAGSRRGTPYRAKTVVPGFVPEGIDLVHLTEPVLAELLDQHGRLDFREHLWPLIEADVRHTYERFGGTSPQDFDIRTLARPFDGRSFRSASEYQTAMLEFLEHDAATSAAGTASPEKMAIAALHAARMRIKPLLTAHQISNASRLHDVEGWFESLVEGLASGPPLQRIEELAALARAGVVEFLGPDPVYGVDREHGLFLADSPTVSGARYSAAHMVEAMMPPNKIPASDSPLVHSLLQQHLAYPAGLVVSDHPGERVLHKGFAVTEAPYRLRGEKSSTEAPLYVLGLQLSSVHWGTAIAAEAGGDPAASARTLLDAQEAAADILRRLTEDAA